MQEEGSSLRKFNVIQKLGQGSFSCVYKVQRADDNNFYAMKKVKINQMKQKEKQNALNEIRILASISHPNIVNYKDAFFDQKTQTLCIVMQLADAGDIQKKINDHKINKTYFNEVEIWQALIQMTKGLKVLHQIQILHRDLKCANVFCTKDAKYKLGDLNVSKVAKRGMARTQTGTPYYTSPEVWNDRTYDSKCDIWSLGCVIYQMASLNPPFRANNLKQLYTKIQKGIYPNIPPFYSEDLKFIISQCLKVNPTGRPSAVQLLQHSKVLKNMPSSEAYNHENNQTSKAALLKTILVPKNMRQLKEALPGSKYGNQDSLQKKYRRVNSAQNLRPNLVPSILSPKAGQELNKYNLKYALMRRPSQNQADPKSQIRDLSRNNSNIIVKNNISERGPVRMNRNNSVDYIRNRVNSRQSERQISSSRKRQNSFSKQGKQKVKVCMEDISNRCRQIQQRVKNLMDKKKQAQEQRNPNVPYYVDKKYAVDRKITAQRQRQNSIHSNRSRNNSISRNNEVNRNNEVSRNNDVSRNNSISRNNSYRSIQMDKYQVKRQESQQLKKDSSQDRYRKISNQRRVLSRQRSDNRLPSVQLKKELSKKIIPAIVQNRNYLFKAPPKYK